MSQPRVLILGASGMLGSMILSTLAQESSFDLTATVRSSKALKDLPPSLASLPCKNLDAEKATLANIEAVTKDHDWVINAIGIIKPYIHDDNPEETERATRVNALFPHLLARAAQKNGGKVIQIATDCVYSGTKGKYTESDNHDALDVYGKTKSLGEVHAPTIHHLRCSIIGPEPKGKVSLLEWFLKQPKGSSLNGFTNHIWNGVTTLHFARLCLGIIKEDISLPHLQHLLPSGTITKANLLRAFAKEYKREDIIINSTEAPTVVDRTLATQDGDKNRALWRAAGYKEPPSVEVMVGELARYDINAPKK